MHKEMLFIAVQSSIRNMLIHMEVSIYQIFLQFAFTSGICLHFMQALVFSKASCLHFPEDF